MAKNTTSRYEVAEHLRTPEAMAAYLEACTEEANGDAFFIAKDAGLSRESRYKALSGDRSPSFDTILKVTHALGIELHAQLV